jgi:hypothetical protein
MQRNNRKRKTAGVRMQGNDLGVKPLPGRQTRQCVCDHTDDRSMWHHWIHPRTKAAWCDVCLGELPDTTEAQIFYVKNGYTVAASIRPD